MNTSFQFDHLVVAVRSLETAVRDYRQLGFNVSAGGRHTHAPTRNALVYFKDGSYIELIEWTSPAHGAKWYDRLEKRGEGIIDFALCPAEFSSEAQRSDKRYEYYEEAVPGSRVQADGLEMRWLLGWPKDDALPFLCADITARRLRVPEGDCRIHPNGVLGIRSIAVQVHDVDEAAHRYEQLLQSATERMDHPWFEQSGLQAASVSVGETRIFLVSPEPESKSPISQTMARDLSVHGPKVYRVALKHDGQITSTSFDPNLMHGAHLSVNEGEDHFLDGTESGPSR